MATKYLDSTGLAYFWSKIKAYGNAHWGGGGSGTSVPTANTLAEFDSTAHMNSTDMTASEVSDFVDSLEGQGANLADFVVEQGTSGIWTYRKWNSGIAECWETWTSAAFAPATAVGGFYGRVLPNSGTFSLPSGLFVTAPIMTVNLTEWGSGYFWGSARAVTSTSFKMTLFRNDNASSAGVAKIYAIGSWK